MSCRTEQGLFRAAVERSLHGLSLAEVLFASEGLDLLLDATLVLERTMADHPSLELDLGYPGCVDRGVHELEGGACGLR